MSTYKAILSTINYMSPYGFYIHGHGLHMVKYYVVLFITPTYGLIMRNIVSYIDISFILRSMISYVGIWVYNWQYGFIWWHTLHIMQCNAICHMSTSYGLIIRNIVQNVGIWFILRSMSSYVDIGFIMHNIVPICRHMIYEVDIWFILCIINRHVDIWLILRIIALQLHISTYC